MSYARELDKLNKKLQLMAAENAISDQRLKAVEIKRKMSGNNGNGYSNNVNSTSSLISPVNTSSPMNNGLEPPAPVYAQINYFSLPTHCKLLIFLNAFKIKTCYHSLLISFRRYF